MPVAFALLPNSQALTQCHKSRKYPGSTQNGPQNLRDEYMQLWSKLEAIGNFSRVLTVSLQALLTIRTHLKIEDISFNQDYNCMVSRHTYIVYPKPQKCRATD